MRLFDRLWLRLLLAQVAVLVVTVATLAVFAHHTATRAFDRYLFRQNLLKARRVGFLLGNYFLENGSWTGVQLLVVRLGEAFGDRILLATPRGRVLADSSAAALGRRLPRLPGSARYTLRVAGSTVAELELVPLHETRVAGMSLPAVAVRYVRAVARSLVLSAVLGIVLAALLTLLLSRLITAPLARITEAAQKMAAGDLGARVAPEGGGEIGDLARAFNRMAEALQQENRLRQNMVADVAHELRTPLATLYGYLEALRDGVLPPDPENLAVMQAEAEGLRQLVDDLHDLALAEAKQLPLHFAPVSLADVARPVLAAFRLTAEERGLHLNLEVPEDLPPVRADARRLAQILRNLVSNAVRATGPGGQVTVGAALHPVPEGRPAAVQVWVQDTGRGIPPEDLPYVFERFYRGDKARARDTGGAGIGLTIVRQLVLAHGGEISVDSQVGRGSTFRFTLPLSPPGASDTLETLA